MVLYSFIRLYTLLFSVFAHMTHLAFGQGPQKIMMNM